MIPGMITCAIVVVLLIGVSLLASWLDHPRESWYDKTLKRIWKDTKE